jgi:hypothetical protein
MAVADRIWPATTDCWPPLGWPCLPGPGCRSLSGYWLPVAGRGWLLAWRPWRDGGVDGGGHDQDAGANVISRRSKFLIL